MHVILFVYSYSTTATTTNNQSFLLYSGIFYSNYRSPYRLKDNYCGNDRNTFLLVILPLT